VPLSRLNGSYLSAMGFPTVLGFVSFCILVISATPTPATHSGTTVTLGAVEYFLPPKEVATISTDSFGSLFGDELYLPITVVKNDGYSTAISSIIEQYLEEDDVISKDFLEALYVPAAATVPPMDTSAMVFSGDVVLPPGPYFLSAVGKVYEAWRLYSDIQGSFTESAIANGDGSFSVLPAGIVGQKSAIAVPSRLYHTKTVEKPLAGVRMGIKDLYDIKGLRTSNGNRAWYWLYPPANTTAVPVQKLIDAGAIIVGKMITSQFANGEVATADWVDYHEAFNPRGDGYQDTSSSSSGGGAGAASYPWLDIALGSDTGGSVRNPAQVNGVYGNRPSHGLVGLEHVMPLSPTLDTPGLLARDPLLWAEAAKVMYAPNITYTNVYPSKIKALDFPSNVSDVGSRLAIDFLADLKLFLNATITALNLESAWAKDNPDLAPLDVLFNETYTVLITQEQIPLIRDPFYADYATKYGGRRPAVDPVPLVRWAYGESTSETLERAYTNKTIFQSWFNTTVLPPSPSTCSESLLVYQDGIVAVPNPRNQYLKEPRPPLGFSAVEISGFSEAPDFTVPIGETPYKSTITGLEEQLPVSVNFMAAKGCDGMLFGLIGDLYKAGVLKKVKAGRSALEGGEILMRRAVNA
jgi:hypothetical protein